MLIPVSSNPALALAGVTQHYGPTVALDEVNLTIGGGSIHAILGENGAGKSTLVKILSGIITPTRGAIRVDGAEVALAGTAAARQAGIATVFQELSLVPHLSISENVMMTTAPRSRFGWIDRGAEKRDAIKWLAMVGLSDVDPGLRVMDLPLARRQLVEIAKALACKPRILILDEATASLGAEQVTTLFTLLRRLRDEGRTIIFISHRMHEIDAIADHCSVLRNGRHIETFPTREKTHDEICTLLAGRELSQIFPERAKSDGARPVVLSARGVACGTQVRGVDLDLHRGEILGLGGLEGQGQKEFVQALFGTIKLTGGEISLGGRKAAYGSPADAIGAACRMVLLPEDRKVDGLLLAESVSHNIALSVMGRFSRFGLRDKARERRIADAAIQRLRIKASAEQPVGQLSGGNQQKVLLARLLALEPEVLLLLDPTRGIDVGTKHEIYRLVRELAAQGTAVLFLSTDYEELIGLCDRVLVFYGGRVRSELDGPQINEANILAATMNIDQKAAAQ